MIELILDTKPRDLGGFSVRRALPNVRCRHIGPFVFVDHMGPAQLAPGAGLSVRPHPHINLATVTYLFEGEIVHRDSLGSHQAIEPGAINWMTAGRGIVHSERTVPEREKTGSRLHGVQLWVALPEEHEESEPAFHHHPADALPTVEREGACLRVLIGSAYGASSPVRTFSPMAYVDAELRAGAELELPNEHSERALYVASGALSSQGQHVAAGQLAVIAKGADTHVRAEGDTRCVLLSGEPLGPRHMWWNFVSSSLERIEQAKGDWKEGRFPLVPGDDKEFTPLPE